jgi:hypothetical protein
VIADQYCALVGDSPIFVVPVPFPRPVVSSDGLLGVTWDGCALAPTADGKLIGTWARAPYPACVLIGNDDTSMICVRAVTQDDPQWDLALDQFTVGGKYSGFDYSTAHTLVWAYVVTPVAGGLVIDAPRFAIGDRVVLDPWIQLIQHHPTSVEVRRIIRGRVERAYGRAQMAAPPMFCDEFYAGYFSAAGAYAERVVAAFALLNCRNVVHELVEPAQSRASRRRGDPPPYRYHVLKVRPGLSRQRAAAASTGDPVAIHWVRGHFKIYTTESPLFGRLAGCYWWQPHLAGRAGRVVEKDYAVQE